MAGPGENRSCVVFHEFAQATQSFVLKIGMSSPSFNKRSPENIIFKLAV